MFNLPYNDMCKAGRKAVAQGMRTVISTRLDAIYAQEMDGVYDYIKEHGGEIELYEINREIFVRGSLQVLINKSFSYKDDGEMIYSSSREEFIAV